MPFDKLQIVEYCAPRQYSGLEVALRDALVDQSGRQEYISEAFSMEPSLQGYLREVHDKQTMIQRMFNLNSRYVSNVSIGFRVRPITPHVRYKPYNLPKREERHRTRSENNDNNDGGSAEVKPVIVEAATAAAPSSQSVDVDVQGGIKRAKSLENIVSEKFADLALEFKVPELEIVNDCIEKLKVDE